MKSGKSGIGRTAVAAAFVLALSASFTMADKALSNCATPEFLAGRAAAFKKSSLAKKQAGSAAQATKIVGLTLVIDFPEERTSITKEQIEEFCNRKGGVGGNSAAGSVYDYFYDVSGGLLEYTNIVTPVITVDRSKVYYDKGWTGSDGSDKVHELITNALNKLKAMNFDISGVTTETVGGRKVAVALNVLYAGKTISPWCTGLWPHAGTYSANPTVTIDGIGFSAYQVTELKNADAPPDIGTFVHENGHLIMGWPDLYDQVGQASDDNGTPINVVGQYCVMAYNTQNPQMPNPYLRDLAGWIDVTDISNEDAELTHAANSHTAYKFARDDNESYYIEARRKTGRSADLPGEGLIIWHTRKGGNNTSDGSRMPLVKVV
jgi:M6 family metalloprotease-like protein